MDGRYGCREGSIIIKMGEAKKIGYIKAEEVRGYRFEDEMVCRDCATRQELKTLKVEEVITDSQINDDDYYFCDRCEELLQSMCGLHSRIEPLQYSP